MPKNNVITDHADTWSSTRVVVMAKRPVVGRVKTRLTHPETGGHTASYTPAQACMIHTAMMMCVLERVERWLGDGGRELVLALDEPPQNKVQTGDTSFSDWLETRARWQIVGQGEGDLGQRMGRVWQRLEDCPIVFLGVDCPDVPADAMKSILSRLNDADVAIGPVSDGGYWTLATGQHTPGLLTGIDWGTANVYHQTLEAAARSGLQPAELTAWHDVDGPADLLALRRRLLDQDEPALVRLRLQLDRICKDTVR